MKKRYRPNVAAIILSSKYPEKVEIFFAKRNDLDIEVWQVPQGGIDEGETPKEALLRELKEEIGTDNVEIIAEFPEWVSYDFPDNEYKKMYNYDGQRQKYFLVRLKSNSDININTKKPEFDDYKFVPLKDVFKVANHFKRNIYRKVIKYFQQEGYL